MKNTKLKNKFKDPMTKTFIAKFDHEIGVIKKKFPSQD